ncbi:hypothetical protein OUZ56_006890 [Daphnia magna]|uniref:Uncharacterized protein n=1 Tax=Daphnia magna TaxID=35525 RepID=A0ABQ9YX08_9CRUS|nr:hypothetical protein OUZ56_006890 [Daphnia magna]
MSRNYSAHLQFKYLNDLPPLAFHRLRSSIENTATFQSTSSTQPLLGHAYTVSVKVPFYRSKLYGYLLHYVHVG